MLRIAVGCVAMLVGQAAWAETTFHFKNCADNGRTVQVFTYNDNDTVRSWPYGTIGVDVPFRETRTVKCATGRCYVKTILDPGHTHSDWESDTYNYAVCGPARAGSPGLLPAIDVCKC